MVSTSLGPAASADVWVSATAYEAYVGRWSRLVAREFLSWLAVPAGSQWLDVGCGTGALTEIIVQGASPSAVTGVDPSRGYIASLQAWYQHCRARAVVGDAQALPLTDATFNAVVSGIALNFVRQERLAISEMARVARPGATVAAYVWDYGGDMQLMRHFWDVAVALDPVAYDLDEGRRFPICKPEALVELFRAAGLHGVEVRAVDVPTVFRDFDDYWSPFLGGQGPAPGYAMSLTEERREALRDGIRASLPVASDGSIQLIARAWAVRGTH